MGTAFRYIDLDTRDTPVVYVVLASQPMCDRRAALIGSAGWKPLKAGIDDMKMGAQLMQRTALLCVGSGEAPVYAMRSLQHVLRAHQSIAREITRRDSGSRPEGFLKRPFHRTFIPRLQDAATQAAGAAQRVGHLLPVESHQRSCRRSSAEIRVNGACTKAARERRHREISGAILHIICRDDAGYQLTARAALFFAYGNGGRNHRRTDVGVAHL